MPWKGGESLDKYALEIGRRIRGALDKRGMTQRELAERVEITEAAMSRYVSGKRTPGVQTLMKMAKELFVPLSDLIPEDDQLIP